MSEISSGDLVAAAKRLLEAPVRDASINARFVEAGTDVVLLTDDRSRRIGDALETAARDLGATPVRVVLERPQERPLKVLPPEARAVLPRAPAVVFAASAPSAERSMREQLASVVRACNARHARLPDVSETAFVHGLGVDHRAVVELGKSVAHTVEGARAIEVESDAGTKLRMTVTPGGWVERLGEIVAGATIGFPTGGLFTSPESVDGVFVADACLGEFFGAREGLLSEKPVTFEIEKGRVVNVRCPRRAGLEAEIKALLGFAENSNRIGLVVLGVNVGVTAPTGDVCVDQYLPGLHLGLGDPGGKSTVAAWKARTAFAACQSSSRVSVDGVALDLRWAGRAQRS